MPRTARQVLQGIPHHIVLRGNNRRRLFSYDRDYRRFLLLMHEHLPDNEVALHAFCLMPNHVHLLLTPYEEAALGRFIKCTAQPYAQFRNKRYRTTGKLFEQRYYSKPMKSDAHLAVATAYIDLNPVRAHLLSDPARYNWSTFRLHAGLPCRIEWMSELWSPSDWYQALATDAPSRAAAYQSWVAECRERDEWGTVRKDPLPPAGAPPTRPNRSRAAG